MSFNLKIGQILALATDENVYRRGERYYNDGNVVDISVIEQENPPGEVVLAKVAGSRSSSYNVRLAFRTNGMLESYRCNCDAAAIWKGACKHAVAVMLGIANQHAESFNKAYADKVKTNVIDHFKGKLISKIDSEFAALQNVEHRKASLVPTLYVEGNVCSLGFSVGFSRQYVVRNVKNFVLQVQSGVVVKYGKGLEFRHDITVFDEPSRKLIDALIKFYDSVRELEKLGGSSFRMAGAGEEARFIMPAWFSDIFFEIYGETGFMVNCPQFKTRDFVAMQRDTCSMVGFNITDNQENILVLPLTNLFVVIEGENADYFLTPDGFCKLGKDAAADFIALSSNISRLKAENFVLEDTHAADFRTYVMPQLQRSGLLAESMITTSELSVQSTEVLDKLCFYLDAPAKGERVTCRVQLETPSGEKVDMFTLSGKAESYEHLWVRAFLQHYGFEEDRVAGYYLLSSDDLIYNFYLTGIQTAVKMGQVFATDAFENRKVVRTQKPSAHVRIHGGLLEVELELDGYSLKELADAISSYKLSKKYHRLRSGRFINLEDENIRAVVHLLDSADAAKKEYAPNKIVTPLYRALEMGEEIRALDGINAVCDDAVNKLIIDLQNYDVDAAELEVPQTLESIMRSYQKTGFRWLKTLASYGFGGILADEMGLGKTLQMISLLLSHKQEHGEMKALVVAPTSLIYNWESEIHKFAPSLNAVVVAGNPQRRKELLADAIADGGADVIITTYDMLKRDGDSYSELDFDYIIADEAQYMKNPATQNSVAVKAVNGRVRFALTGTPIENSVSELWSIFDFVMPGFLYSQSKFNKTYANPITKDEDQEVGARLRRQVAPFILRRKKADVLAELPEKVETIQYSAMTETQRMIYNAKLLEAQGAFESLLESKSFETSKLDVLAHITRLRQICAHPALFLEGYDGGSGKLSDLLETIQQAIDGGHRILMFSQFASMLRIIREVLQREKISFFYLDGSTESALRKNMADQFNNGEKDVFLISLRAGGLGLNLTGADIVIHYDQWWNPAVMNQATDRAHRIGQSRTVQVINLIMKDSIEEKILKLQERKKALTDIVISEGSNFINKLSVEDIRELFSLQS